MGILAFSNINRQISIIVKTFSSSPFWGQKSRKKSIFVTFFNIYEGEKGRV